MFTRLFSPGPAPAWMYGYVSILVFLFPGVIATTNGLGSIIFTLLVLPSLYYGRGWRSLETGEKRFLLGILAVFLAMSLSLVNSENVIEGVGKLERYLRLAMIVPLYLMFRRFELSLARPLAWGALLACLVMAAQGWYQVAWQGNAFASGYYHKIVFGDLAILWSAIVAALALTLLRHKGILALAILAIVAGLYASLLSNTRGAWLFIPVFVLLLVWVQWRTMWLGKRTMLATLLALALILVGAGLSQQEHLLGGISRGVDDLQTFANDPRAGTSWGTRLSLWHNSWQIFKESPLLGTGLGDFHHQMILMAEDGRSWTPAVALYDHAHSIYFDALANAGLIGLIAMLLGYLALPLWVFNQGIRTANCSESRFYALGGMITVLAFATFGLSEGLWARNPFINTYAICLVVLMAGMMNHRQAQ